MSTSLAVGAVTAVLRGLIQASLQRRDLDAVLGASPEVSSLPPDRIAIDATTPDRINLFLFQATENAAWRNMDLPSRNGRGERISNSKLALDLHYLVTAYGSADFRAEVLLGHAMFVLHETPVLTRQDIRDTLAALPPGSLAEALAASRLAEQFEQIRIAPRVLSVEEVSKIWTALQSQYRTTAAYHASVVLVEAEQPARTPLPVLTRGRPVAGMGRDEGVFVEPTLLPPVPTLHSLDLPAGAPAIRLGETLGLRGHHLAGDDARARFRRIHDTEVLELDATADATDAGFDVDLPSTPAEASDWQAGVYEVTGRMEQGGTLRETNRLPLVLAPRLDDITPTFAGGELTAIEVICSPPVRPAQSVVLVVSDRQLLPEPFETPTETLTFPAPLAPNALPTGELPVRLRVDGIESLVIDPGSTPPQFSAFVNTEAP